MTAMKAIALDLSFNNITDSQPEYFVNFTQLERIFLNGNLLTRVPADISFFIPNINWLNLDANKISVIKQSDFEGYSSIKYLFIENNGLENLEANVFRNLPQITQLSLSKNGLLSSGIKDGVFNVSYLHLSDNNITALRKE